MVVLETSDETVTTLAIAEHMIGIVLLSYLIVCGVDDLCRNWQSLFCASTVATTIGDVVFGLTLGWDNQFWLATGRVALEGAPIESLAFRKSWDLHNTCSSLCLA